VERKKARRSRKLGRRDLWIVDDHEDARKGGCEMGDETRARHEDPRVHAALDALEHRARALRLLARAPADLAMGRRSAEGAPQVARLRPPATPRHLA